MTRSVFDFRRVEGGVEAEREERRRHRDEEKAEQVRNFEAMQQLQNEARERRQQNFPADQQESRPTLSVPGMDKLYGSMLEKIGEKFDGVTEEVQQVVEEDELPALENLSQDAVSEPAVDVSRPPVRSFQAISTTGSKLESAKKEESATAEQVQTTPSILNIVQPQTSAPATTSHGALVAEDEELGADDLKVKRKPKSSTSEGKPLISEVVVPVNEESREQPRPARRATYAVPRPMASGLYEIHDELEELELRNEIRAQQEQQHLPKDAW